MENENPLTPNSFYDYDDELTRMMQERDAERAAIFRSTGARSDMIHSPNMERTIMAEEFSYTAVFEPADENGFVVTFPALPGLITEGDTLAHARVMAAEALQGYLESLAKDGLLVPAEDPQPSMPLIRETVTAAL